MHNWKIAENCITPNCLMLLKEPQDMSSSKIIFKIISLFHHYIH